MPFPLSWRSDLTVSAAEIPSIAVDEIPVHEILGGIRRALRGAQASNVTLAGERITYRVAWWRPSASRSNVLAAFDRGTVSVRRVRDGLQVDYEVSLRRLLWIMIVLFPIFLAALTVGATGEQLVDALPRSSFLWFFLYGASLFIALVRYPAFLRRVVIAEIEAAQVNQGRLARLPSA